MNDTMIKKIIYQKSCPHKITYFHPQYISLFAFELILLTAKQIHKIGEFGGLAKLLCKNQKVLGMKK